MIEKAEQRIIEQEKTQADSIALIKTNIAKKSKQATLAMVPSREQTTV